MKAKYIFLLTMTLFIVSGCSGSIGGTVVDADTGQPVEGAVVLAEWTRTSGKWIGLRATDSYKVVETITDKAGKFSVRGVLNPLVDPPHLTIYKKGYVAWNNEFIFPDYKKRRDFILQNGYIIKMEKFNEEYSYDKHEDFIMTCIHSSLNIESKKKFLDASKWEEELALQERTKKRIMGK